MKLGLDPHFTNEHEGLVFEHKLWGLLWCKPPKWVIQPILGNHTGFYQPKLTFWQIWNLGIFPKLTGSVCVGKMCPICGDGPKPTPCFWQTAINHTGNPQVEMDYYWVCILRNIHIVSLLCLLLFHTALLVKLYMLQIRIWFTHTHIYTYTVHIERSIATSCFHVTG